MPAMQQAAMLMLAVLMPASAAASEDPGVSATVAADEKIRVEHDPEAFVTKIRIRTDRGRVEWADVLRGLARARGYDDSALEGVLPERDFDVASRGGRVFRVAWNLALRSHIRFDVQPSGEEGGDPWLVITMDREALAASKRRIKGLLREGFGRVPIPHHRPAYGLKLDDSWDRAPGGQDVVVLIHGLHGHREGLEHLHEMLRTDGHPCGLFAYPNDQPIQQSARLLAAELAKLEETHPDRGVALVTHSMGGLVARAVIEAPELDPGNVRRLVMIAPPNHGSALARFSFGLEVYEHLRNDATRKATELFYASVEDGLAEAATDLRPGSPLLHRLNARGRNPNVRYTIFLGTRGPLTEEDLAAMRRRITDAGETNRWVRFFGSRAAVWLEDLDEVVQGKGDGVVSVRRGRLEGVADTVVLPFRHVGALRRSSQPDVKKLQKAILARLKEPS